MNAYDVDSIADDLLRGSWTPRPQEVSLGRALFHRCERIEEESLPPGMPPLAEDDPPWLTQVLAGQAALARELEAELLPVWRHALPASPMVALVEGYVEALRPVAPYARRMVDAWADHPPARSSAVGTRRWAQHRRVTVPEAVRQLALLGVRRWEQEQLTALELRTIDDWHLRAERVGLVLSSAVLARS